eukprot:SAG11_NODE_28983_length_315_cov_1.879630_1_plen_61_part_01
MTDFSVFPLLEPQIQIQVAFLTDLLLGRQLKAQVGARCVADRETVNVRADVRGKACSNGPS